MSHECPDCGAPVKTYGLCNKCSDAIDAENMRRNGSCLMCKVRGAEDNNYYCVDCLYEINANRCCSCGTELPDGKEVCTQCLCEQASFTQ